MNTAGAELVFHVFGVTAHFGRHFITERTHEGIVAVRAHGKHSARPLRDPDKLQAPVIPIRGGLPPTTATCRLGRSTLHWGPALVPEDPPAALAYTPGRNLPRPI